MRSIILIKIGSQLLTTEEGSLDLNNLREIVKQCAKLHTELNHQVVLVSSGAITCGKKLLEINCDSVSEKQAAAAVGQINLCHQYKLFFNENKCHIAQILITKDNFSNNKNLENIRNTFETLFKHQVIPIINENDTVSVDEINFGDNDQLAVEVAQMLNVSKVIFLTSVDGLYKNPNQIQETPLSWVPEITEAEIQSCQTNINPNSKGGMLSKLMAAKKLLKADIPAIIANGRTKEVLIKVIRGEFIGTHIQKTKPHFNH